MILKYSNQLSDLSFTSFSGFNYNEKDMSFFSKIYLFFKHFSSVGFNCGNPTPYFTTNITLYHNNFKKILNNKNRSNISLSDFLLILNIETSYIEEILNKNNLNFKDFTILVDFAKKDFVVEYFENIHKFNHIKLKNNCNSIVSKKNIKSTLVFKKNNKNIIFSDTLSDNKTLANAETKDINHKKIKILTI